MDNDAIKTRNKIYEDLHQLSRDLVGFDNDRKSLMEICIDFEKTWSIDIATSQFHCPNANIMEDIFQTLQENIMQEVKRVVVVGRSSCGKSTFINALLTESILPITSNQHFVEIRPSATTRNYAVINKMEIDLTNKNELEAALSRSSCKSNIEASIFYDGAKCQFINENIFITETIGLEHSQLMHEFITENHSDIDLVIIIVDARKGISEIEKSFISNHQDELCNLTVFIVYNFWDVVVVLRCEPSGDDLLPESNIFRFAMDLNSSPQWNERNDSFANLIDQMKKKITVNAFNRKFRSLDELYSVVEGNFRRCQFSVAQMRVELNSKLNSKLNPILDSLTKFNALINGKIKEEFSIAYEDLLKRGLEALNPPKSSENKQAQINNVSYALNEDDLNQRLKRLVEEVVDNCLKELKLKILESIPKDPGGDEFHSFRKSILEQLYFPFCFDLSSEIDSFDISVLRTNLEEISKCVKVGKGVTIGLTAGLAALGIATGGAAFAIIGLAEAAIVAAGLAGGGAIAGSAIGAGTSFGIISAIKKPFQFAYKKNEENIRAKWNSFESVLSNTYEVFVHNIASNITQMLAPIEDRLMKLENNLNNTKEKLNVLQNYSIIY